MSNYYWMDAATARSVLARGPLKFGDGLCISAAQYLRDIQEARVWIAECEYGKCFFCEGTGDVGGTCSICSGTGTECDCFSGLNGNAVREARQQFQVGTRTASPPTRLAPLRKRLRSAIAAAWSFWIKPWDREDYDEYSSLRSPSVAWMVAWGIHHDDREVIQ